MYAKIFYSGANMKDMGILFSESNEKDGQRQ
jgi:hypothetical protein